jgi:prevent-host-death family protein
MPNPLPQTVPISELRRQQDKILKMAESAPVVLMSRSEPAGVLVSPQEWNRIVNRLRQLEVLQEARSNIARNEANNSWVSSEVMRRRMQEKGLDIFPPTAPPPQSPGSRPARAPLPPAAGQRRR